MQDKKIRISVEDQKLNDLGRSAKTLANDMIRQSRQYTTSSKEVLKDLEEQIRLIEKRNKLDADQQKTGLQTKFGAGQISKSGLQTGLSSVRVEAQQDRLQIQLLREVIETVKATSKNEIREDRIGVEKQIRGDKTINRLGVTGDPQQALKRTIQQALLGDIGEEETDQRSKFKTFGKFGKGAGRAFNTAAGLGTSKNELYALAGVVGLTPVIGQGLSALANRFLSAGESAEGSMSGWAGANMGMGYGKSARDWRGVKNTGLGISLGMDPSSLLSRRADLMRTMGKGMGTGDFMQTMGAESYIGSGNINQLAGVSRYGQGNMAGVIRVLEAGQRSTTTLTENVAAYVQASNTSLNISSNVNEAGMAKNIVGISRATNQSGRGLNQVTGAIQGLGKTSNPIVKSLMMRAFRQSNPNASLFDVQSMMEDPLANLQKGGGQFFENLRGMTGGGQMYKQVLHSVFGGQLSRTRIGEILDGGGDFTQIAKEAQTAKEGGADMLRMAEGKTGIGARYSAKADATFQELGLATLEKSAEVVEKIKELFDRVMEENEGDKQRNIILKDQLEEQTKQTEAAIEDLKDAKTFRESVSAWMRITAFAGGYD